MESEYNNRETSCWKGTSEHKLQQAEDRLLELAGLPEGMFRSYKVEYELNEEEILDRDMVRIYMIVIN